MRAILGLVLALVIVATACGGGDREEILVFVAASLADVMDRVGREFSEAEGTRVRFNLGGSGYLAQQIVRGAPADAFISAGDHPMELLRDRDLLVPGSRRALLANELVLVVSEDGPPLSSVEELATMDGRVAIADPELAPAGAYARQALKSMDLWDTLRPRIIFGQDVRVSLGYVKTGNVDAGIVYRTDVQEGEGLRIVAPFSQDTHTAIVYPGAVLSRSSQKDAAEAFLEFLTGESARQTFRGFGFPPHTVE